LLFWTQDSTALFVLPKPKADRAMVVVNFVHPTKVHISTL